jgi:hypothetical protein
MAVTAAAVTAAAVTVVAITAAAVTVVAVTAAAVTAVVVIRVPPALVAVTAANYIPPAIPSAWPAALRLRELYAKFRERNGWISRRRIGAILSSGLAPVEATSAIDFGPAGRRPGDL